MLYVRQVYFTGCSVISQIRLEKIQFDILPLKYNELMNIQVCGKYSEFLYNR